MFWVLNFDGYLEFYVHMLPKKIYVPIALEFYYDLVNLEPPNDLIHIIVNSNSS